MEYKNLFRAVYVAGITMMSAGLCRNAQATFSMNIYQNGANVVATGSGTINLTGLNLPFPDAINSEIDSYAGNSALSLGGLGGMNVSQTSAYGYNEIVYLNKSFANGGYFPATSGSGDLVGVLVGIQQTLYVPKGIILFVPKGYVSGTYLSDTSTWNNTTIAGLGLIPGTYTFTWGESVSGFSYY